MSKENKKPLSKEQKENLLKEQLLREQETLRLIFGADALLPEKKYSDRNLEREFEKITLRSGVEISIKGIKDLIAHSLQSYSPTFPPLFYSEIDRLNKWNRSKDKMHQKPPIVAKWTLHIIYWRFSKDIVPVLQNLNPFVSVGVRLHKHFQWLTEEGKLKLQTYISEAIDVMKTCDSWYEFRITYAKKYGLPVQLRMWENEG